MTVLDEDLLRRIVRVLGVPTEATLSAFPPSEHLHSLTIFTASSSQQTLTSLDVLFGPCQLSERSMLQCLLTFDPQARLSAEKALAHPYVADWADPADEVLALPSSL